MFTHPALHGGEQLRRELTIAGVAVDGEKLRTLVDVTRVTVTKN